MNPERLLEVYDQISEAPDTIARLRRFVLDLAVRGKLVDQDPTDAHASVLISKAKALKAREGVKEKPDSIEGSDIPFSVPVGWHWTCVGTIALQTGSGSTPRGGKSAYADKGTPFLRSQNIYDEGLRLDDVVFINDETNTKMKRTQVKAKDLLLNITGGSIGRCTRVPDDFLGANVSQHVAIIRTAATGTEDYLHLLVRSPFFQEYVIGEQTGAGRGGLPKNRMDRIPVPLPPLAEQHRIVAKVDELMALCDRLEEARKTREETRDKLTASSLARLTAPDTTAEDFPAHANFALEALPALTTRPDQIKTLRQTILNLAVRGKLVEQNPTDEPASALLERIGKERMERVGKGELRKAKGVAPPSLNAQLFQLPSKWEWSVADQIWDFENGDRSSNYPSRDQLVVTGIPFVNAGHLVTGRVSLADMNYITPAKFASLGGGKLRQGDQIYCLRGSLGKHAVFDLDCDAAIASSLVILRPIIAECVPYLALYLDTDIAQTLLRRFDNGSAQPNLSSASLRKFEIPLPPLAEQHRIVAKVNALMALCDRLDAALTTTDTTRSRLLEALLHEALEPSPPQDEVAA